MIRLKQKTLVLLVGPIASGKSTFAEQYLEHIVSADTFHGIISGDENNQDVSKEAFELLYKVIDLKMSLGFPVVVDNLNIRPKYRRELYKIADKYNYDKTAIVFDNLSEEVCVERNKNRSRVVPEEVVRQKYKDFEQNKHFLQEEGLHQIIFAKDIIDKVEFFNTENNYEDIEEFAVIGDVHGCLDELRELINKIWDKYPGRKLVFVGDLVDRGPNSIGSLTEVFHYIGNGRGFCVIGNHENKFLRWLKGNKVKVANGLQKTINDLDMGTYDLKESIIEELEEFPYYLVFDHGKVVVSHAGIDDWMIGKTLTKEIKSRCIYGKVDGFQEDGYPNRLDFAAQRQITESSPLIIHGHTVVDKVEEINKVICVDTGCVVGGELSAYIYPEKEVISVKAKQVYYEDEK